MTASGWKSWASPQPLSVVMNFTVWVKQRLNVSVCPACLLLWCLTQLQNCCLMKWRRSHAAWWMKFIVYGIRMRKTCAPSFKRSCRRPNSNCDTNPCLKEILQRLMRLNALVDQMTWRASIDCSTVEDGQMAFPSSLPRLHGMKKF